MLAWVPRDLLAHVREMAKAGTSRSRRLALAGRGALILALCAPFLASPGQLFAYPISDCGFRLLFGNRLQAWAMKFMQTPSSQMQRRMGIFNYDFEERNMPDDLKSWHTLLPNRVITYNETHLTHLDFINGGGFGHWGIVVGGPDFSINTAASHDYMRQMWPGVYYYSEIQ